MLEHAVPSNIFESLAQNDVLQMVVFFFLFGAACSAIGAKAQPVVDFAECRRGGDVSLHEVRDVRWPRSEWARRLR